MTSWSWFILRVDVILFNLKRYFPPRPLLWSQAYWRLRFYPLQGHLPWSRQKLPRSSLGQKTRSIIQVDLSLVKHCKGFFMIFVTLIDSLSVSGGPGIPPNFKAELNIRLVDWVVYCPTIHRLKPIVIVNLFVDEVIKIVDDVILSLVSHLLVSAFVCKRS